MKVLTVLLTTECHLQIQKSTPLCLQYKVCSRLLRQEALMTLPKRHRLFCSCLALQGGNACHDHAWCRPVKVFGHLRKALPNSEGQIIIAHQLLDCILPHAQSVQASQRLQQVCPQHPGSSHCLSIIQKSVVTQQKGLCH